MRQPAGDLAPRRDLLGPDERGHVVEDEDGPFARAGLADQRRGDRRQMELVSIAREGDLLRRRISS